MIGKVDVINWQRVSPRKDDPARAALEEKCNAMFALEDKQASEAGHAYETYRNAKLYTKKREALEKRYEKIKEKNAASNEKNGHKEIRIQYRQMTLEDLAEYSECPSVRRVALAELGHITYDKMRKDIQALLCQEAGAQGVPAEDVSYVAGSVMNSLIAYPSHMNGPKLVHIEWERVQKNRIIQKVADHIQKLSLSDSTYHNGVNFKTHKEFYTELDRWRAGPLEEAIPEVEKILEVAKEQSKLWKKHLKEEKRSKQKKKDGYFKAFVNIDSEYGKSLLPKVMRETGLRKYLRDHSTGTDFIWTAINTGWATDGRFMVLLPDEERTEIRNHFNGHPPEGRLVSEDKLKKALPHLWNDPVENVHATCNKINAPAIFDGRVVMLFESPTGAAISVPADHVLLIESRWPCKDGTTAHIVYSEKNNTHNDKLVYIHKSMAGVCRVVGMIMGYHADYNRRPNEQRQASNDAPAVLDAVGTGKTEG